MRVLPLHVANKIAAGEVVERPASVVKELVENAIDAGAGRISVSVTQGGRRLVAVQDDGCGMTRDDAVLSLERQATSKILDVSDIEKIDTLGFRGEAIPSIASVSRFTMVTRRADSDEGTRIQVNAGTLAEVCAAGCPAGTLVEVRDLFCNVPARRKFLRAYTTEEGHVRSVFTLHALAHPEIGFSLSVDGRELYRLAPSASRADRVRDIFGAEFLEGLLTVSGESGAVRVSGYIERPGRSDPLRHDQYVFVNGRPATAPTIAYALREACPRQVGDRRPAAILFIDLPPSGVDVNVHPTKREVRFRDGAAVRDALITAIKAAITGCEATQGEPTPRAPAPQAEPLRTEPPRIEPPRTEPPKAVPLQSVPRQSAAPSVPQPAPSVAAPAASAMPAPAPVPVEFAIEPDSPRSRPWRWFRYLAQSESGYLLIETDAGIVTINPHAARERVAYERLVHADKTPPTVQTLLIPETVQLGPVDFARVRASLETIQKMGFQLEEFGRDTFKVDAVPQLIGAISPSSLLSTIARDLADGGVRRGERWREELIAKSIARSFAGASQALTEEGAVRLVEDLCSCQMPYVCPRGKPVMIFTSTRELDRKFAR